MTKKEKLEKKAKKIFNQDKVDKWVDEMLDGINGDDGKELSNKEKEILKKTFPVKDDKHYSLTSSYFSLAITIMIFCKNSRERSLALTKLEESLDWAKKANKYEN